MEYSISSGVAELRSYQYRNRRAESTLKFLNSETGIIVEPTIKRALERQGFVFDDDLDNKSHYVPQACFDGLERYTLPIKQKWDTQAWDAAYAITLKAFDLKANLRQVTDFKELALYVKAEKSSGAPEFGSKGDSLDRDFIRMRKWLDGKKCPDPCVAYHRVQHGSEGPKTRLVWGYPQSVTLAEAQFARPLINAFIPRRSPMAMGKLRVQLQAQMTPLLNSRCKYGLDMSRFDASVSPKLINMAFAILAHNFDWQASSRNEWEKVKSYFIHTPILMPDGYVYIKHRGVPSGSYFTQLIDSVVNFFIIQYVYYRLTGECIYPDRIKVLGDDSLFSSNRALSLQVIAEELELIGMTLNVEKSCLILGDGCVEFLGHSWEHGFVNRDKVDISKRMVYKEKHSNEKDGRKRIRNSIYPYLNDATSAYSIIREYQFHKVNDLVAMFTNIDVDWNDAQTGWKEHLSTVSREPGVNDDTLVQAYIGILR